MRTLSLILLLFLTSVVFAQPIVLTVVVDYPVEEGLYDDFEAAHPGVSIVVEVVALEDRIIPRPETVEDVPEYVEKVRAYAARGDLLYVESENITPASIRTGAFLNLSPLVDLSPLDMHPALLQSFEIEGSLWALPFGADLSVLLYNPAAFDEIGLAYPDETWTLDDFMAAARQLENMRLSEESMGILMRADSGHVDAEIIGELIASLPPDPEPGFPPLGVGPLLLTGDITDQNYQAVLLPGGSAAVMGKGYAISAGTDHPELAFELAVYHAQLELMMSDMTASMPVEDPFIQSALENAFSYTEGLVISPPDVLDAIENHASTAPLLVVATPVPTQPASEDGIIFGMGGFRTPLPNQTLWDAARDSFEAEKGIKVQITNQYKDLEDHLTTEDCFYLDANVVPFADLSLFRSLDLLMDADTTFNPDDLVHGTLNHVTRDDAVWGMPVSIQPVVMWYDRQQFEQAGLPEPQNGWTVSEFEAALRQLGTERPPFRTEAIGDAYLIMLISAYGGRLYDASGTYFDDPATIEATRQVLNLARDGYLHYQALSTSYGGHFTSGGAPIYMSYFDTSMYRDTTRPYRPVTFPRGIYTPISYGLGVIYISAESLHPEACYDWISHIIKQPGLFYGMPAHRSMLDVYADGDDVLAFYRELDTLLQRPDTLFLNPWFDGAFNTIHTPELSIQGMARTWLARVFDHYVLENADLEAEMIAIQQYVNEYRECVKDFPSRSWEGMTAEESIAYFKPFEDCALAIDPTLESRFRS